ncbi:MAG TPA: AmmeMemoRadiSam system protein B [Anaeromyxobacteraceae bacterium]|nr:AmmeMemoRadiSam system protein B [Anaeromyxobacteraceae bacterium]
MTPPELDRPRLAPLDPRPVTLGDGSQGILLRDPLGVLPEEPVLTAPAWVVLAHCDGNHSVEDIHRALERLGAAAKRDLVEGLIEHARNVGILEGPAYAGLRDRAVADYRRAPVRKSSCAGSSYPADAKELRAEFEGYLAPPEGPGAAKKAGRQPRRRSPVTLLVSPHIDYARGGHCYAHAWRAAAERCDADLFVVFGTAHASPEHLFTLTRQSYATPLGTMATDADVVDRVAFELGEEEVLADELCHKGEHSCELPMVWLQYLLAGRDYRVLPVLCSSISQLSDPARATDPFLRALRRAVAGRKVCYVAGADLAHVGPQFGDPRPPTREELRALAAEDRHTLSFVEKGDAAGFHRAAVTDDARRRLCGTAPVYAALRMAGVGAHLLHYGQWTDGVDSVSFAAAAG